MKLEKIDKLHSNMELVLAIVNNYCEKHDETPEICGATKESRELLGDILKISAGVVLMASFVRMFR